MDVWSAYNESTEYPPRAIRLPITQLLSGDSRNMPCAIPQLRCTTKALLPGLTFSDESLERKTLGDLLFACSGEELCLAVGLPRLRLGI